MNGLYITSKNNNLYFYDNKKICIEHTHNTTSSHINPVDLSTTYASVDDVKKYLQNGNGFKNMILEVTQDCNLRCRYCYFSNNYEFTRNHNKTYMSFEVAKASIGYYLSQYQINKQVDLFRIPQISFSGGEPLLNFNLIKDCISYINKNYISYPIKYEITTNATLLKDDITDFLVENNTNIIISLDGDKNNHNRNRLDLNGNDTFDEIYKNICDFKDKYPNYKEISLNICYDYSSNLKDLSNFIDKNNLNISSISKVNDIETKYYNKFTKDEKEKFEEIYNEMEESFFYKLKNNLPLNSLYIKLFLLDYIIIYLTLNNKSIPNSNSILPYTGSCIPGERLFVSSQGKFYTCERINSRFPIGNISKGLDYIKIASLINDFNTYQPRCKKCNISSLCSICLAKSTHKDNIYITKSQCLNMEIKIKKLLTKYIELIEENPKVFENAFNKYFI